MNAKHAGVLLVNPPITPAQRSGPLGPVIRNLYFNSPPLGLAYLAAVLERANVRVDLVDAAVEDLSAEDLVERMRAAPGCILGLTSTTNFFCNALDLAEKVKSALPDTRIVIGGPHATMNSEAILQHACFDYVCIGEGEITIVELVRAILSAGNVAEVLGIAFRRDGKVVRTPPRPYIADLDTIPMPARHLLPLHKYIPQPNDGPYLPKTSMITSRGCPYPCIFCDHGAFDRGYRSFSAKRIVDEVEELVTRHGIRDIAFVDSLFMISRQRVNDIVDELLRRRIRVHWTCTIRANVADYATLSRMKAAGCWRIRIGIEAGNEEVLRLIRKQVTKAEVRKVVEEAHAAGLHPKAFFMVGHVGETRARILESIAFAKSLPLTDVTVQINTPMPGTTQWSMIEEYGTLRTRNTNRYSFWEPVFTPKGLTAEELSSLHRKFYRDFYFRPVVFWRHLKMIRTFGDFERYVRALALLLRMFVLRRKREAADNA